VIASQPRLTPLRTHIYQTITGDQDYRFRAKLELSNVIAIAQVPGKTAGQFVFFIQLRNREPDYFYVSSQEIATAWLENLKRCQEETRKKRNTLKRMSDLQRNRV
jgi:hypothetical protein